MSGGAHDQELEELYEFLYLIPVAIMKTSLDGAVLMANPESVRILTPIVGPMIENLFQIVDPRDPELVRLIGAVSHSGPIVQDRRVTFLSTADEKILSFDVFRSDREQLLVAFRDVTALVGYERQLEMAALTDPLTALPNRRAFTERCQLELDRVVRYRRPLSLVMGDADHFKKINDRHGHAGGDAVLKAIAACLTQALRSSDIAARIGGEEFALLLPEIGMGGAAECAERALVAMQDTIVDIGGEPVRFTMSFGVCEAVAEDDVDTLLSRADQALYDAKLQGRNRVACAS